MPKVCLHLNISFPVTCHLSTWRFTKKDRFHKRATSAEAWIKCGCYHISNPIFGFTTNSDKKRSQNETLIECSYLVGNHLCFQADLCDSISFFQFRKYPIKLKNSPLKCYGHFPVENRNSFIRGSHLNK